MDSNWTSCVKCNLGVLPPWNGCASGHIICINCFNSLSGGRKACPKCNYIFNDNKRHSLQVLENIAKNTPGVTCKCINKECTERIHLDALGLHVGKCKFSKIVCRICRETFPKDKIWEHSIDKHNNNKISNYNLNDLMNNKIITIKEDDIIEKDKYKIIYITVTNNDNILLRLIINITITKPHLIYMYCDMFKLIEFLDDKKLGLVYEEFAGPVMSETRIALSEGLINNHTTKYEMRNYVITLRLYQPRKRDAIEAELVNSS